MRFSFIANLILIIISICKIVYSIDESSSLQKRYNRFLDIGIYSNHTLTLEKDKDVGLYCRANDYIVKGQTVLRIPKEMSICAYDIFPFKHDIVEILNNIPRFAGPIKDQKVAFFVLVYQLMYQQYADKDAIREYIKENKLTEYYIEKNLDPIMFDGIPLILPGLATMNKDHLKLVEELGYPSQYTYTEQQVVFDTIKKEFIHHKHNIMVIPWISDLKNFQRCHAIVASRSFGLRHDEFKEMEPFTKEEMVNFKAAIDKNILTNVAISKTAPGSCLVSYLELCNHYHPKRLDMIDSTPIALTAEKDYIVHISGKNYKMGDEYAFTYSRDPNNQPLAGSYGFNIRNNIFNKYSVLVSDITLFSKQKVNLAIDIGSLDPSTKELERPVTNKKINLNISRLNKDILNLGRILALENDFNYKETYKFLIKGNPISHKNEIDALKYHNSILNSILTKLPDIVKNNIKEIQYFRNRIRHLLHEWRGDEDQISELNDLENYKLIYEMDVSYKIIVNKNLNQSLNQMILRTNNQLNLLKNKYLNN